MSLAHQTSPESRFDNFANELTDIGSGEDPHSATDISPGRRLDQEDLDILYETGRFARKIVEMPPKDAFRPEIRIKDGENDNLFEREWQFYSVEDVLKQATMNARHTGGGAVLMMVQDGRDLDEPIDWDNLEGLDALHAFDRWDLSAHEYHTDLQNQKYRLPRLYNFHPNGLVDPDNTGALIHSDRIIRFEGKRVRDFRKSYYSGWGQPVLEAIFEAMKDLSMTSQAIASSAHQFQYGVLKLAGLHDVLMKRDDGPKLMRRRLQSIEESKSITNHVALDADRDEEMKQISADIDQGRQAFLVLQEVFSYNVDIPLSRLFGQQPPAFQSADEGGRQDYFDNIEDKRQGPIKDAIHRIARVLGTIEGRFDGSNGLPPEIEIEYGPLDELTAPNAAEVFIQRADGHTKLVKEGIETAEEANRRIFSENIDSRVPETARSDRFDAHDMSWDPSKEVHETVKRGLELAEETGLEDHGMVQPLAEAIKNSPVGFRDTNKIYRVLNLMEPLSDPEAMNRSTVVYQMLGGSAAHDELRQFFRTDKYEGPNDSELPDNVKEMSEEDREKWVEIFNAVLEEHGNEQKAAAIANSKVSG